MFVVPAIVTRFVPYIYTLSPLHVEFRSVVLHVVNPPTHTHPSHEDFVFVSMRLLITRLPAFHDNYFNYVDAAEDIYRKLIESRVWQLKSADSCTTGAAFFKLFFPVILMGSEHARPTRINGIRLIRILIRIDSSLVPRFDSIVNGMKWRTISMGVTSQLL